MCKKNVNKNFMRYIKKQKEKKVFSTCPKSYFMSVYFITEFYIKEFYFKI